jgi:hypothetical protein
MLFNATNAMFISFAFGSRAFYGLFLEQAKFAKMETLNDDEDLSPTIKALAWIAYQPDAVKQLSKRAKLPTNHPPIIVNHPSNGRLLLLRRFNKARATWKSIDC